MKVSNAEKLLDYKKLKLNQILLPPWNKNFLTEICRNMQTLALKVLQECSFGASGRAAVQMFFLTPNSNIIAEKFVNSERLLAVLQEHIIFNVKWVEVRKMSEVFWAKLYCKMSDPFCSVLLALRVSARKCEN